MSAFVGEIRSVGISDLTAGDSPRLSGIDMAVVRGLVEADPATLPPIVVDRSTMRVFDGLHRLAAAKARGETTIMVEFADDWHDAFVRAVRNNATHGKPLTLPERRAAAERIFRMYPEWSDRKVAEVSNLSKTTVAKIRSCSTGKVTQLNTRTGRDGRRRPVNADDGRRRVVAVLADHPAATLRELAAKAGVALGTAKDVRDRVRRGEPAAATASTPAVIAPRTATIPCGDNVHAGLTELEILSVLTRDPSLVQRESCRKFVQWLAMSAVQRQSLDDLVRGIPPHLIGLVRQLVRTYADTWLELADKLDELNQDTADGLRVGSA